MNANIKSYRAEYAIKDAPKIKKLNLRLTVNGRDLEKDVKRAFDLAKSAGQELDLTFSYGAS